MQRRFAPAILAILVISGLGQAQEKNQPGIPLHERIVAADVIVVGKVVDLEKNAVNAPQYPGSPPVNFKVVTLKIDDAILAAKGAATLRAGFVTGGAGAGGGQTAARRAGFDPKLEVGQEGCFFLMKHHKLDLVVVPLSCPPIDKSAEGYDRDVALARKAAKLLADPMAGLKSTEAEDRLFTAGLLSQRYATVRLLKGGTTKLAPIPEDESKLILNVMYDAAWNKYEGQFYDPLSIFRRLRLGQDGNVPILTADKARAWLEQNKDSYRIMKRVEAEQDEAMSDLLRALKTGRVLLMDGAMGTELQRAGLGPTERPEDWNLSHPRKVLAVHDAYIAAGAEVILTNSFQANPTAFRARENARRDLWFKSFESAVEIASTASTFIAAAIGPIMKKGQEFPGLETLQVYNMAGCAEAQKADAVIYETCSSARVRFALTSSTRFEIPNLLSLTYRKTPRGYKTQDGHAPRWFAERAEKWGVAALGVNCGVDIDVADCAAIVRQYREACRLPLFARPNAGTPQRRGKRWIYPRTPQMMAAQLPELLEAGAAMIGGCCGTTPEHIAAFRPVIARWNRRRGRKS